MFDYLMFMSFEHVFVFLFLYVFFEFDYVLLIVGACCTVMIYVIFN